VICILLRTATCRSWS